MNIFIGENIKRLRKSKDITQEQLADAMNISCAAVSKWERGETYPDITMLFPLAYYFGVTIDELMGYDESKINREIEELLAQYRKLYAPDTCHEAHEFIKEAYKKYPNDYRIMHCYMWQIAGGSADNDIDILLSHKEEFTQICNKLLIGCTDTGIRMEAYTMLAKLLWAEGKTEEALSLFKDNMTNWYATVGQKSEQLFAKDTPEFLYWVRKNMYELVAFAADKLSKSIFFDATIPYEEKVRKIESYSEQMMKIYNETNEDFFLVFSSAIMGRLANDLKYRNGIQDDVERTKTKAKEIRAIIAEKAKSNPILKEVIVRP